ncbi:hypothetical protein B0H15DRAFT_935016 [Mycena belliarum]|uniref:Uncharacterized protein n=1 Tax=Mycena belliarum TaxID=1033014 RepID=A0AAD6XIN2_9AGAR|nr:hypothetical protein B0H15DRAFT_935016 [Mycena belliae]
MPALENHSIPSSGQAAATRRGANNQRSATHPAASKAKQNGRRGGRKAPGELEAELERVKAQLAQALADAQTAKAASTAQEEDVERIERPKGEAGDRKNGFILQDAMKLEDDDQDYRAILRTVHASVGRVGLDFTQDFRQQDPAKLAAVYKLTRKKHPYLTRARFPLDWAQAEMVKQYLRNKRRYSVRRGYIPNRETRKHEREEGGSGEGNDKRHKGAHIDDLDDDEDDEENSGGGDDGDDGGENRDRAISEYYTVDFPPGNE